MAQILVRDLDDDVKERLAERARKHGRSTVAEIREILRIAAFRQEGERPPGLGSRIATRFANRGLEADVPESGLPESGLLEARGQSPRPADFDS